MRSMADEPKKGLAALAGLRDALPPGTPPREEPKRGPARAVVRLEKKGRGGKEVTVIEQLELPARELDGWCRALKQSLGSGGTVEGDSIVVQGDQRPRVKAFLEGRGVRRVSVG